MVPRRGWMERDVAVIHREFERVLRPGERADVKWHLSSLGGGGSRRAGVGGGARRGGGGGGGGRVGAVTTRGGDGVEVVVDAVEVVVDGRHHPAAEVVVLVHARRGVGIGGGVRRAVHAEPLQERRDARARRLDARDKLGKGIAVEVLCGSEGRRGREDGSVAPARDASAAAAACGWSGGKIWQGRRRSAYLLSGEDPCIFPRRSPWKAQEAPRAALPPSRAWHSPSRRFSGAARSAFGTGNRFVSDEEVPKRARESDRPIASRFSFFGELRDEGTEASDVCGTTRGAAPWVGSPKTAHRSGSASSASSKRREERINSTTRSSGAARPPPTGGPLRLPQHHHGNITRPFRRPRQHPTRRARDRPPRFRARARRVSAHTPARAVPPRRSRRLGPRRGVDLQNRPAGRAWNANWRFATATGNATFANPPEETRPRFLHPERCSPASPRSASTAPRPASTHRARARTRRGGFGRVHDPVADVHSWRASLTEDDARAVERHRASTSRLLRDAEDARATAKRIEAVNAKAAEWERAREDPAATAAAAAAFAAAYSEYERASGDFEPGSRSARAPPRHPGFDPTTSAFAKSVLLETAEASSYAYVPAPTGVSPAVPAAHAGIGTVRFTAPAQPQPEAPGRTRRRTTRRWRGRAGAVERGSTRVQISERGWPSIRVRNARSHRRADPRRVTAKRIRLVRSGSVVIGVKSRLTLPICFSEFSLVPHADARDEGCAGVVHSTRPRRFRSRSGGLACDFRA